MAKGWPKFIRDPIHGLMRFDSTDVDRLLLELIHCKEFQRLRRIKQLGFGDMVYPGATHTRFAHSIGVMWNAKRFLRKLQELGSPEVKEEHRIIVLIAALLHDLGHGPFSHAFEKISGVRHEKQTVRIILDDNTEINKTLRKSNIDNLATKVAQLFPEGAGLLQDSNNELEEIPDFLKHVISSQFDADRCDYLVRDSHFAGTEYGRFDLDWLLIHLRASDKGFLYFSNKGVQAAESYVFARYHMYQSVYFHKTTRAAEVMFRLFLLRFKELVLDKSSVVANVGAAFQNAFNKNMELSCFLRLDDASAIGLLHEAVDSSDRTLQYLALGLLNRRLFKCVDVTGARNYGEFYKRASEAATVIGGTIGIQTDMCFEIDLPSDVPYKVYEPTQDDPSVQIYIENGKKIIELSTVSDTVRALTKECSQTRCYYLPESRNEIEKIAKDTL